MNAALASIAASAILISSPFVFAATPLWPFLALNWLLFMSTGYLAFFRPFRWTTLVKQPDRPKLVAFNAALLAFAIAGWVAIFNADRLV